MDGKWEQDGVSALSVQAKRALQFAATALVPGSASIWLRTGQIILAAVNTAETMRAVRAVEQPLRDECSQLQS